MIQAIALIGVGGAPAHEYGVGKHALGDVIPAGALHVHLDANGPELLCRRHGHSLTDGVAAAIQAGELRFEPVLFHDAVSVGVGPASVCQELLGIFHIGFQSHLRVVPGHAVIFGVAGRAEAVEGGGCHLLPVDGVGHGLADFQVAGDVVANGLARLCGFAGVRLHRQGEAPVIHGSHSFYGIARHLGGGQGGGGEGNVHLSRPHGCQGGILILEDDGHLPDGRRLAVIVVVGFQNELLLLVPLDELVGAGPHRIGSIVRTIGVFRHDAHGGNGVEEGRGGFAKGEYHRGAVYSRRLFQKGEVQGGLAGLCGAEGKGHVLGGKGLPIGKEHIVPNGEGPGEAVAGQGVARCQVVDKLHVIVIFHQGALDQGGGAVAPALAGVQSVWFAGDGDDHFILPVAFWLLGLRGAAGEQGRASEQGEGERKNNFFHGVSSCFAVFYLRQYIARPCTTQAPLGVLIGQILEIHIGLARNRSPVHESSEAVVTGSAFGFVAR